MALSRNASRNLEPSLHGERKHRNLLKHNTFVTAVLFVLREQIIKGDVVNGRLH